MTASIAVAHSHGEKCGEHGALHGSLPECRTARSKPGQTQQRSNLATA